MKLKYYKFGGTSLQLLFIMLILLVAFDFSWPWFVMAFLASIKIEWNK